MNQATVKRKISFKLNSVFFLYIPSKPVSHYVERALYICLLCILHTLTHTHKHWRFVNLFKRIYFRGLQKNDLLHTSTAMLEFYHLSSTLLFYFKCSLYSIVILIDFQCNLRNWSANIAKVHTFSVFVCPVQ